METEAAGKPEEGMTPEQRAEICLAQIQELLQQMGCSLVVENPEIFPAGPGQFLLKAGGIRVIPKQ